jgi:hypothetical protein
MGRGSAAREELARVTSIARTTYVPAALIAGVHLAGDVERTFEYLERAVEERGITPLLMPLGRDCRTKGLRATRPFETLSN